MVVYTVLDYTEEKQRMRVLLIEDDLIAARGVSLMLKAGGAVVDHADTGEEGARAVPPL